MKAISKHNIKERIFLYHFINIMEDDIGGNCHNGQLIAYSFELSM